MIYSHSPQFLTLESHLVVIFYSKLRNSKSILFALHLCKFFHVFYGNNHCKWGEEFSILPPIGIARERESFPSPEDLNSTWIYDELVRNLL